MAIWVQHLELKFGRTKNVQNFARFSATIDFDRTPNISGTGRFIKNRKATDQL